MKSIERVGKRALCESFAYLADVAAELECHDTQDHFAGLLRAALPPTAPPVVAANMRQLCEFAHMVYDVATQTSTLEADVRLTQCLDPESFVMLQLHGVCALCTASCLLQTHGLRSPRHGQLWRGLLQRPISRPAGDHDHGGPVPGRRVAGQAVRPHRAASAPAATGAKRGGGHPCHQGSSGFAIAHLKCIQLLVTIIMIRSRCNPVSDVRTASGG